MTTLTVGFKGVLEEVLNEMVKHGFAKTKTEALRACVMHYGEEMGLVKKRFHARAEELAYQEIKRRWNVH